MGMTNIKFRNIFFLLAFLVGTLFPFGSSFAQSIDDEFSSRAAQVALDAFRLALESMKGDGSVSELCSKVDARCDGEKKEARGKNSSGDFVAVFLDDSDEQLGCGDGVAKIRFIRVEGSFANSTRVLGARISFREESVAKCGSANGSSYENSHIPEADLCEKGSPSPIAKSSDGKQWVWLCIAGDANVSCSASVIDTNGLAGKCGDAAKEYLPEESVFSGPFCSKGNSRPVDIAFPVPGASVSWRCVSDGYESEACIARRRSSGSTNDCSLISDPFGIPDGYGPPFNMLSSAQEPVLTVSCDPGNIRATAGSSTAQTFVYNKGFVYAGGSWQSISFSGMNATGNPGWLSGKANSSLLPEATGGAGNFVIAFVCQYVENSWKCGCRDKACANSFWTLQKYK